MDHTFDTWVKLAIFALILLSFLRRIAKLKTRTNPNIPTQRTQDGPTEIQVPPTRIQTSPPMTRPRTGKKNDFRDVPPPPENPDLG